MKRNDMASADAAADFRLPGTVASSLRLRFVVVANAPVCALIWRTGEQRDRE